MVVQGRTSWRRPHRPRVGLITLVLPVDCKLVARSHPHTLTTLYMRINAFVDHTTSSAAAADLSFFFSFATPPLHPQLHYRREQSLTRMLVRETGWPGPHVSDRSRRFYRLAMQPQHGAGYFTVDRRGEVPTVDIPTALFSIFINSFVVF